ncbi:hypothetical protein, partial [Massilia glaciei]
MPTAKQTRSTRVALLGFAIALAFLLAAGVSAALSPTNAIAPGPLLGGAGLLSIVFGWLLLRRPWAGVPAAFGINGAPQPLIKIEALQ